MMLDFYGIRLVNEETGELERAPNWRPRSMHLNRWVLYLWKSLHSDILGSKW